LGQLVAKKCAALKGAKAFLIDDCVVLMGVRVRRKKHEIWRNLSLKQDKSLEDFLPYFRKTPNAKTPDLDPFRLDSKLGCARTALHLEDVGRKALRNGLLAAAQSHIGNVSTRAKQTCDRACTALLVVGVRC